ncbi:MAG: hypothetical protein HKN57_02540 [Xanthomonadales bacterium]|nr:hypothetical protein [Gammaproteobacteria bacterium]MBT8054514.1 hypothetical protein [Gammaproteobacteria bacterium]NND56105.1 hypothetical protein [Xanthomonadales bacterium]NNK52600.1 hypothetical protein [Xanthomonadales bacterium]
MNAPLPHRPCLHLVVTSSTDALGQCRAQFNAGDSVLFLDDGVMHITDDDSADSRTVFDSAFFSAEDLAARGLARLAAVPGIRTISDPEFDGLLARHAFCLTWK